MSSILSSTSSMLSLFFSHKALSKPVMYTFLALVISCGLFMSVNAHLSVDNWQFILQFRGKKLLALMIVGFAIGVSTLLFQTITHNPILTPSLLGFDALYILLQSVLVFSLGTVGFSDIAPLLKFAIEISLMFGASLVLFRLLFRRSALNNVSGDLVRLILVGIVFGILFRSLSSLVARMISPEDFVVIQSASFASFNTINPQLMLISLVICIVSAILLWCWRNECDVLMLGQAQAVNLGINYFGLIFRLLTLISILVATATAFVGPLSFLGLLVCAITNRICQHMYHQERLILVSLLAMLCLVLGQTIFEQFLGLSGVLSVVIEFVGGIAFLVLVFGMRGNKR